MCINTLRQLKEATDRLLLIVAYLAVSQVPIGFLIRQAVKNDRLTRRAHVKCIKISMYVLTLISL